MADKKEIQFENIKAIGTLIEGAGISSLIGESAELQKKMNDILKKLGEKERTLAEARLEREAAEAERLREESRAAERQPETGNSENTEKERVSEPTEEIKAEAPERKVEAQPAEIKTAEKSETRAEVKAGADEKAEPVAEQVQEQPREEAKRPAAEENKRPQNREYRTDRQPQYGARPERPQYGQGDRPQYGSRQGERPAYGDRPQYGQGDRPQYGGRQGERPAYGDRPQYGQGDRPQYNNRQGERPQYGTRPAYGQGDRPQYNAPRGDRPPYNNNRPGGPGAGTRPQGAGFNRGPGGYAAGRPVAGGPRPALPRADAAPVVKETKNFGNKKKSSEKSYDDKKTVNKRALIKQQVSVDDFDEEKSGYRKLRVKKSKIKEEQSQYIKIEKAVITSEIIPLKVLSEKIGISAVEITKRLFKEGIIKTINDTVDYDTAGFIAADLGIELELKLEKTAEERITEFHLEEQDDDANLVRRPPVITVMGHVDHGKTSLLDRIRHTNVTGGEAGGITQHIGAYSVTVNGKPVTFLDTPGHEAFTAMRARGAQVTDIAIIVIAADDGIMPQTVEAINHAKAAGVTVVVAANKIDKPTANLDRIKQQLTEHDILIEEWGGEVIFAPVSAKTGEGVDSLLETLQLIAEVKDLKANPDRKAKGVIIEAKLDKGKGPVATVLVQNGTLKTGDNIVAGTVIGRVRAMIDDKGRTVKEAGPSVAVSVLGLEEVPNVGDNLLAVEQEKLSKLVAEERKNKEREAMTRMSSKLTLEDVFKQNLKTLNIIVKADVQGSAEAVKQSLVKLSNEEVAVSVIHSAAGAINESDIMLADSSNAIII